MEERQLQIMGPWPGSIITQLTIIDGNSPQVKLSFENFDSGFIEGRTIYHAMQSLHKILDEKGLKLLCNCFRYDVRPSRMSVDMGGGVQAYIHRLGKPATERVNIFDPTDEPDAIVSFEEQLDFNQKWLSSLK